MKAAETHTSTTTNNFAHQAKSTNPFFQKEGQNGSGSMSKAEALPFFQPKLKIGQLNSNLIQRSAADTKELCPKYHKYDDSVGAEEYNCAGLSNRTYKYIGKNDLIKILKDHKHTPSKAKPGTVIHIVWYYDWYLENSQGKPLKDKSHPSINKQYKNDFHTVAGVVDKQGNEPNDVYSKNGMRPIEGAGTFKSFVPKKRELATENTPKAEKIKEDGKPTWKIRKNIDAFPFVLPCPK